MKIEGYILDIMGDLPVMLMEIDTSDNSIKKTYIYANAQIIAQHEGVAAQDNKYFYLHDRLGSVREIIDTSGDVVKYYTYKPFGETLEYDGTFDDSFRFTGQYFDSEIDEYYFRARQYNPHICRFISRDPTDIMFFQKPLTFRKYLYCGNNSLNMVDPTGLWILYLTGTAMGSFGWSGVRQSGIVIDGDGNVGWINITGIGAGSPVAALGVSFAMTSADTIFDLQGVGCQIGGGVYVGGLEFIAGQNYVGFEATVGLMVPVWIPFEIHGHVTHTTVYDSGLNWREMKQKMDDYFMDAIFNSRTLGEAYSLLTVWSYLQ